MALLTRFPGPVEYPDLRSWASALVQVLSNNLGNIPEPPVGLIILYGGVNPPAGYLQCNGDTFSSTVYPALSDRLQSTTLPNIPDVGGFHYGIRVR